MKKYIAPELVLCQAMTNHIIATSFPIVDNPVEEGWVKEDDTLNFMWDVLK